MALIGTISGSVGVGGSLVSATAISGTLVIADSPGSVFPSLPSDVKFFVSGSTTGTGENSVFGGRVVISGSTELKGNLTLSGTNVEIGGDVTFNNDLLYLDKANDRVGIGTSTPEATLSVLSQGTGNTRGFFGEHYDNTTAFSQFKFIGGRSRGSVGSPSAVQANDTLVSFNGRGRTDVGWSSTVGGMYFYAKENWTSTNTPTYITLRGVAAGAGTTVSEWARIESTGLNVAGDITGSNLLLTNGFVATGSGIIESNTSDSAFRVTQQGSGNAITVEDSSNPDSTPFVVTSTGRVGIGTTTPTSYMFLTGADVTIPLLTVRSADASVDTLVISSSAAADGGSGIIRINQGNLTNKAALTIANIGGGTSGIRMTASGQGYLEISNFNTSPQLTTSNKNLAFNTNGSAYDTSQVSYKFTELNKTPAYPNQKTFLISGNTSGFKTGSYFEVEKSGSIKLLELQGDVANNALFVSGNLLVTGSIFTNFDIQANGNITGSNALVNGDLAVNGGDITSKAASLNISAGASGLAFQLSGASFATFVSGASGPLQQATLQAATNKNLVLAGGAGKQVVLSGSSVELRAATSGAPSGIDFSTEVGGLAQSYLNVTSGSYAAGGATVLNTSKIVPSDLPTPHDVLLGASATRSVYLSGSSIYQNAGSNGTFFQRDGSSYGVIQGVSGSSFTIGSAAGVISMNLVSSGNVTVRLDSDNNAAGHKFDIQDWNGISQFSVGENGNAELSGSLVVTGSTTIGSVVENLINSNGSTGTTTFNLNLQGIFYVNAPAGDITANFTNVPTTNLRVITPTVILSQSAAGTARIVSSVTIDGGASQTINWANGVTPTGNAGKQDVFGFSLIRSGSAWKVLGQMSTYG